MNSFNHYSFGAVGAWMYNYSLGIERDENSPGFKHFILRPEPDPTRLIGRGHDVHVTKAGQLAGTPDQHGDDACLRVDLELACAGRHRGPR